MNKISLSFLYKVSKIDKFLVNSSDMLMSNSLKRWLNFTKFPGDNFDRIGSKINSKLKKSIKLLITSILFFSFKIILTSNDLDFIVSNSDLDLLFIRKK